MPWRTSAAARAGLLIGGFAFGAIVMANQLNQRVEANVERSYGRLENWFRWLGVFVRPTQTPYERADLMASAIPEGKASIRNLTRQFVLRRFSRNQAGERLRLRQARQNLVLKLRDRVVVRIDPGRQVEERFGRAGK